MPTGSLLAVGIGYSVIAGVPDAAGDGVADGVLLGMGVGVGDADTTGVALGAGVAVGLSVGVAAGVCVVAGVGRATTRFWLPHAVKIRLRNAQRAAVRAGTRLTRLWYSTQTSLYRVNVGRVKTAVHSRYDEMRAPRMGIIPTFAGRSAPQSGDRRARRAFLRDLVGGKPNR